MNYPARLALEKVRVRSRELVFGLKMQLRRSDVAGFGVVASALALGFLALRRKKIGFSLAALLTIVGLSVAGCSSGSSASTAYVTPQGNSTVTVTLKDASGSSQSFTFGFTVLPPITLP